MRNPAILSRARILDLAASALLVLGGGLQFVGVALALQLAIPNAEAQESPLGADLPALLDYARSHNVEYAAMRLEAEAANERIGPAGALPDPKLQVELRDITRMGEQDPTLNPSEVGSTKYLLMQEFPWFGKRGLREGVALNEAKAAENLARGSWTELAALIRQTHLQRYFLRETEKLTEEQLALVVQLEKIAQARYASGLSPQADVIRAQLEQNAMRSELISFSGERRGLISKLNALLNRPNMASLDDAQVLPALPLADSMTIDALMGRLRNNNPQIAAETNRIAAAEANRDLAYRDRYPDVSVGVAPIQQGSRIADYEVMLQVNIPLQQGTRRSQEREAQTMLAAARARQDAATHKLMGELMGSLTDYETAQRNEELVRASVLPQSQLSFQSALAGYENGKVDFATLLEAQRQITQARLTQLQAQAEQHLSLTEIEKLVGEGL